MRYFANIHGDTSAVRSHQKLLSLFLRRYAHCFSFSVDSTVRECCRRAYCQRRGVGNDRAFRMGLGNYSVGMILLILFCCSGRGRFFVFGLHRFVYEGIFFFQIYLNIFSLFHAIYYKNDNDTNSLLMVVWFRIQEVLCTLQNYFHIYRVFNLVCALSNFVILNRTLYILLFYYLILNHF